MYWTRFLDELTSIKEEGDCFMKKLVSLMLAVIMAIGISVPAFAEGAETVDVDNTFDNFTPGPGKQAPDNWYDPYCYEEDGRINPYCLNRGGEGGTIAVYCPEYKRIFTVTNMGRIQTGDTLRTFKPYDVFCPNWHILDVYGDIVETDETQWYCPYCGKYKYMNYTNEEEDKVQSAAYSHDGIESIAYGFHCEKCGAFVASYLFADKTSASNVFQFRTDYHNAFSACDDVTDINTVKLYRFLREEHRNSEYSFIFTETEADFGDGKDGRIEDLKKNDAGVYEEWESEDNPYYEKKLTFWEKIAAFFNNIAKFFNSIFNAIGGIFK